MKKDELIAAIKECAQKLGRTPTQQELAGFMKRSRRQLYKLMDGWDEAIKAAGLKTRASEGRLSKKEMVELLRSHAKRMGRTPSRVEFRAIKGVNMSHISREFGGWTNAVRASGLKVLPGSQMKVDTLLEDWALLARKKGRLPSKFEYELDAHHAMSTLRRRVGRWQDVPRAFKDLVRKRGTHKQWADVLHLIACAAHKTQGLSTTAGEMNSGTGEARCGEAETPRYWPVMTNRRIYGRPLMPFSMAFGPINEMGVVFLFGVLARDLGFAVTWIGTAFPDCEAVRMVGPGRSQQVKIEFELLSRNFSIHRHNPAECDLIICWIHNWPECPLEVIELSKLECVRRALGVEG